MKINEILKPCPFCGEEIEVRTLSVGMEGVTSIEVGCRCGAVIRFDSDDLIYDWSGKGHQLGLTAIDKWNRRTAGSDNCGECFGASFGDCERCPKEEDQE